MVIKKLPQHLINKLKAGEIVERPASVVKELVENALDACATRIDISIEQGGKQLIKVSDNGGGIERDDMQLTIERYATSKISDERDLENIVSYGFRGEALASISEVSSFRIQSKQVHATIGHELRRDGERFQVKEIPYATDHGTTVLVQDIFHAIPVREKFLKSDSTEQQYISKLFIDYALAHTDKHRTLSKDGKQVRNLLPADSLMTRVLQVTKPEWEGKLKPISFKDEQIEVRGLAGDATLHFTSTQYFHIFVNGRPVEDKLIKKAVMQAYQRQLVPGTYPFVILFVQIDPQLVDVNVHPRKQEVKFLDPGSIFSLVESTIKQAIGEMKVNYAAFRQQEVKQYNGFNRGGEAGGGSSMGRSFGGTSGFSSSGAGLAGQQDFRPHQGDAMSGRGWQQSLELSHRLTHLDSNLPEQETFLLDQEHVVVVGQLWQSYIILEGEQYLYLVDQHALAERIAFEKMKTEITTQGYQSEILLQPLTMSYPADIEIEPLVEQLQPFGFDLSDFGNKKIIIHAIPRVFQTYKVDIELLFNQLRGAPVVSFDLILDAILGMKACKASIKAGQKLQPAEMLQLIKDGINFIPGMFVCQHGRPSIVKLGRDEIDTLFDR